MQSAQSQGKILRIAVLVLGGLLFVLLLLADKTNLTNETRPDLGAAPASAVSSSRSLPPLAPDAATDGLIARVEQAEGQARGQMLDSLVMLLAQRKRFDVAARYGAELVQADPQPATRLRAGQLALEATRLPHIDADSLLYREFSDMAIAQLQAVTEAEPSNEAALVALGTAYVESRSAKHSPMTGIQTLKKVLEQNPRNAEASYRLGMFSLRTAQYDKAAERFRAVLEVAPKRPDALYGLAVALANTGKKPEAAQLLNQVLEIASDPALKEQAAQLKSQL